VTPSRTPTSPKVRGGLVGAGAAACAVCCAAPLMTLLGIGLTGAAATAFTLAFAGVVFGVVVAVATIAAVLYRRRQGRTACAPAGTHAGPVPVEPFGSRPEQPADLS
jgi:heme/copper-type cytochrome/quinol oxidase subunit 2